jgi:DNA invertase Pin-like site-specific DNA recombinase
MKVALYARVSKSDQSQDPENQLRRLRAYCDERGWEVVKEYSDQASGADPNRPALDRLMADSRARQFKLVLTVKVDRMARSVQNLYKTLEELDGNGVSFECTDQAISTHNATGKLLLTILGGVAEFERELIRDRTKAGLARVKAQGKQLGRRESPIDLDRVKELKAQGWGIRRIAKELGVNHQTLRTRLTKEGGKITREKAPK